MRKAVVGGAAVAVLAVVCLVLKSDGGLPFFAGRHPTTSEPDPLAVPPGGPVIGAVLLNVDADDLSAPAGPEGDISARIPLAYFGTEIDGEVRSDLDAPTRDTEGALLAVLLALTVLRAARDQDRDRCQRAEVPASAA